MESIKHPYLVQHFLENSARRLPDKVALICGEERLTYREINEQADRLAASLIDMGIQRQDRVAIFLDNSTEAVIALFGVLKAGAMFMMLSATMKSKKLDYILNDSGARALITHSYKTRIVTGALKDAPELEHIIWCSPSQLKINPQPATRNSPLATNHSWNEIISRPFTFDLLPLTSRSIDLDLATIIYTSGSTGEPKGVMSAHYNIISAARSITTYLVNVEDDRILCALPLSFDYGLYQVLMAFLFGGTVVLEKSFAFPFKVLEELVHEKVTGFPIVPTMLAMLFQMEDLKKFDFSSLRYISNTAAALPVAHIKKLRRLISNVSIYSMYGLTECKRVAYLPPDEIDYKPKSVGIAMPNEEVFIVDESGEELGPGEIGELIVRGSNVMLGYWNAPEETAKTFRPGKERDERMLYTGDLFKKDEEGFLYFISRKDDLIKTKGELVSPKEIENTLCQMEGVTEAAAIGIPDDILGQAIQVFVAVKPSTNLTVKNVARFCRENLEPFLVPKHIEIRKEFPKSATGKIDKNKLIKTPL